MRPWIVVSCAGYGYGYAYATYVARSDTDASRMPEWNGWIGDGLRAGYGSNRLQQYSNTANNTNKSAQAAYVNSKSANSNQ